VAAPPAVTPDAHPAIAQNQQYASEYWLSFHLDFVPEKPEIPPQLFRLSFVLALQKHLERGDRQRFVGMQTCGPQAENQGWCCPVPNQSRFAFYSPILLLWGPLVKSVFFNINSALLQLNAD
jgi:hypothetical protein